MPSGIQLSDAIHQRLPLRHSSFASASPSRVKSPRGRSLPATIKPSTRPNLGEARWVGLAWFEIAPLLQGYNGLKQSKRIVFEGNRWGVGAS
jgi:hypothetical protein